MGRPRQGGFLGKDILQSGVGGEEELAWQRRLGRVRQWRRPRGRRVLMWVGCGYGGAGGGIRSLVRMVC